MPVPVKMPTRTGVPAGTERQTGKLKLMYEPPGSVVEPWPTSVDDGQTDDDG